MDEIIPEELRFLSYNSLMAVTFKHFRAVIQYYGVAYLNF